MTVQASALFSSSSTSLTVGFLSDMGTIEHLYRHTVYTKDQVSLDLEENLIGEHCLHHRTQLCA